jgi:hypothetical protein
MFSRLLLLLAIVPALLLLPAVARAQDGEEPTEEQLRKRWEELTPEEQQEKRRLFEERWKDLTEEERERRMKLFEERLRDLSPAAREELLEKLRQIRQRNELEKLRRKSERIRALERRLLREMPPDVRERLEGLQPGVRDQIVRHAVRAAIRQANERFRESLTEEERAQLAGLDGDEKAEAVREISRSKAVESLPREEREQLRTLPDRKRRDRMERILYEATERQFHALRQSASRELESLLALSPEELRRRFPRPWRWRHRNRQPGGPRHR